MYVCSIVKLLPRVAVDDLMHYFTVPIYLLSTNTATPPRGDYVGNSLTMLQQA